MQQIVLAGLRKYPCIDAFFGQHLRMRMQRCDWLDNPLIQLLIVNPAEDNLSIIENWLATIRPYNSLYDDIRKELAGTEKEFDAQLHDLLAELHGAVWILQSGFKCLGKIGRTDKRTPDYVARKDNADCIFEVKNLRRPPTLIDLLETKLRIRCLQNPEAYTVCMDIHSDISLMDTVIDDKFESSLLQCLDDLDAFILRSKKKTFDTTIEIADVSIQIEFSWTSAEKFNLSFWPPIRANAITCDSTRSVLDPLIRKSKSCLENALRQLQAYDPESRCQQYILLNWERPDGFRAFSRLTEAFVGEFAPIRSSLQDLYPNLSIVLLGFGNS